MTYEECSINMLFKHSGILLSLIIFLIIIMLNLELGIPNSHIHKNEQKTDSFTYAEGISTNVRGTTSKNENFKNQIISNISKIKVENGNNNKTNNKSEYNEDLYNKVKKINTVFHETFIIYIFHLIFLLFMIIFYSKKQKNIIQQNNNKEGSWYYQCELENIDLIYDISEFLIIFYILVKGNHLSNYNNIFKLPKYITNSLKITILIGPLLNVNIDRC